MNFKEQLALDARDVFLNLEEFAETGELAGHDGISMVVEALDLEMSPGGEGRTAVSYEGVTIHVAAGDVPDDLLPDRETTFRHERWFVLHADSADSDEAMRVIQLYRERA
ncbi:nitrate reductase [uncultured Desulfovibrio sp.]|uniref:nitrate reductase n=1 Tax=uncultured Desulfovibrio sp. TaxID=167968 RepID=UPI002584EF08|nr:nitrate reductase [uncultured Desulfovibrio sp.]